MTLGTPSAWVWTAASKANILPADDADWYYFDAPHVGELRFGISEVDSQMAVSARVWNANRDTVSNWFSPLNTGGNTEGAVDLTAPGRYYLEVAAEYGQRSLQPYLLQMGFTASGDDNEPNDSYETATPMTLDQTIAGAIWPVGKRLVHLGCPANGRSARARHADCARNDACNAAMGFPMEASSLNG